MLNDVFIRDVTFSLYPKTYHYKSGQILLGMKTYIGGALIDGIGFIRVGNYSSIGNYVTFELGISSDHNQNNISSYGLSHWDWTAPNDFYQTDRKYGLLEIGSDVWIGRGTCIKASDSKKALKIGNGAIVAADSVVVKDVPPFAIVGGNPAKFIKWRFDPEIIEALERIAWWNWDLEKVYDNFHLFNKPEEFVKKFDH